MTTAIQIDSSKSTRSGTVSSTSETGSTVGRRIANASIATYPIRRLLRSRSAVSTPSRTRPRTKIGISNAIPNASRVMATKERK